MSETSDRPRIPAQIPPPDLRRDPRHRARRCARRALPAAEQPCKPLSPAHDRPPAALGANHARRTFMARRVRKLADGKHRRLATQVSYAQAGRRRAASASAAGPWPERRAPGGHPEREHLEHALLALGCLVAGVPFVPTSPAYSLVSQDFDKLQACAAFHRHARLVFAADSRAMARPCRPVGPMSKWSWPGGLDGRSSTPFADLLATPPPRRWMPPCTPPGPTPSPSSCSPAAPPSCPRR
jgi:hypothetical protein